MGTHAKRDGGDWVISGVKRWIGLASLAQIAVIWAQTDDGIRGFIVPTDSTGFPATPISPKPSMRASVQCDIVLDEVRVPADAMLPGARGLRGPFECLNEARYGIAWGVMGAARDSFEVASTVGGLAFAPKGLRLAIAQYNGGTLWFRNMAANAELLEWAGSHPGVVFSPDHKFLVTAMHEPALHGWRLADSRHTRVSGNLGRVRLPC